MIEINMTEETSFEAFLEMVKKTQNGNRAEDTLVTHPKYGSVEIKARTYKTAMKAPTNILYTVKREQNNVYDAMKKYMED